MTPLCIAGYGSYRPRQEWRSTELDARFGRPAGWTEAKFGIATRRYAASDETSSMMGAAAARAAIDHAGWRAEEIDVIIGACAVMEQPIPSTSLLIQQALGLGRSGIPAFDVNQTCLSFLTALDIVAMGFESGRWRRALVVSSDIASAGLDFAVPQTAAIFGDGAGAVCVEAGRDPNGPALLARAFESYGDSHELATLRAGGTRLRVEQGYAALVAGSKFEMNAFGVFKAAARCLPRLIDGVLDRAGLDRETVDLVVCHQASAPGVAHIRKLFGGSPGRVIDIFATHGNQIAASLPVALAHAAAAGLARPGINLILLGTAAGISAGAMVLRL